MVVDVLHQLADLHLIRSPEFTGLFFLLPLECLSTHLTPHHPVLQVDDVFVRFLVETLSELLERGLHLVLEAVCSVEAFKQTIPLVLPTTEHELMERVTAYIGENLMQPLQLDVVAQKYGFSGRTLLRLFKDQLGMTFGTYIRVARIARAIELLTDPNATVTEVAFEVGYSSLSSFSRAFQQLTGVKPREYLRNIANGGSNPGEE